jgi:type IV pilus assembly protein PilV
MSIFLANSFPNAESCGRLYVKGQSGFTLIELLIAMLILSGGLLGLVATQTLSLKKNNSAYQLSQATQYAYDLADRMRANRQALTVYTTKTMAQVEKKDDCLPDPPNKPLTNDCTPSVMAENDLYEWYKELKFHLPGFDVTTKPSVTNGIYTITIKWDENQDGDHTNDHEFTTSFRL